MNERMKIIHLIRIYVKFSIKFNWDVQVKKENIQPNEWS